MEMKNVKAITIPEGSVKKITNSNGDIIWGSQDAFPYRRLEYIHFSGAEYLNTKYTPAATTAIKFKMKWLGVTGTGDENDCLIGGYCNTLTDAARRLYFVYTAGTVNKFRDVIGKTWTNTNIVDNDINWIGFSGGNFTTVAWGMRTGDWSAAKYYHNYNNGTAFTGWTTQFTLGSQGTTGNTGVDTNRYSKINVYEGYQHNNGTPWGTNPDSNSPVRHWIPCQRKSDNICGLYDVLNNTFYPMVGTTITSGAAGPVIDEYWDLTA